MKQKALVDVRIPSETSRHRFPLSDVGNLEVGVGHVLDHRVRPALVKLPRRDIRDLAAQASRI